MANAPLVAIGDMVVHPGFKIKRGPTKNQFLFLVSRVPFQTCEPKDRFSPNLV
jgi:hypothetical protein